MTAKINDIQKETIKQAEKMLKRYHKCLVVRPPGFGKTHIAVDIAIVKKYKNAVFLYPTKCIEEAIKREYGNTEISNVYLYTYSKLRSIYKSSEEFIDIFSKFNNKDTIFVFDEAHSIAAIKTSIAILDLMRYICPNANYLGLTATPDRTDKLEIKWHYFDGHQVSEYTIKNAFEDGIFAKPYYIYTPLYTQKIMKYFLNKIDKLSVSEIKKEQLRLRVDDFIDPQKLNIRNLNEVIQNNVPKFKNNMNYYKFILFFTTFNNIHTKQDEIVSAFQNVFPECKINVIIVTSESRRFHKNVTLVQGLKPRENTIDLIFNVNMLALGYHVADITGVMMFRYTVSNIIFTQQVGRCLSVMQNKPGIIFDFVENLYGDIPNSVPVSRSNSSNTKRMNQIDLAFPVDDIVLYDKAVEIREIERLIESAIKEEFEEEVVNAYKEDIVDIEYCIMKLHLHEKEDFMKVLKRYA